MAEVPGRRASRRLLLISLWLTLLVLAVKVWVGWATLALSLIAESLQTAIAVVSMLLSVLAMASHPPSGREVWGHSQREAMVALLLVAVMGFAGISLLVVAGQQLGAIARNTANSLNAPLPLSINLNLPLLQLLGVVMATLFCLACFKRYEAGILESRALQFNASCLFLDVWLMLLVIAGLVGGLRGYAWIDPVMTIALIVTVVISGYRMLARQLPSLMQQIAIAPEALAQTVHQIEGITHCYEIHSHGIVGRQVFVEMRLILHPECLSFARTIAERVERAIRERYGPARVVIYIDSDVAAASRLVTLGRGDREEDLKG